MDTQAVQCEQDVLDRPDEADRNPLGILDGVQVNC